jgi:TonB family protein
MRWPFSVIHGATCGAVLLCAAKFASPQDQPSAPPDAAPLKVCSARNAAPCATMPKPIFSPDPEYSDKARKKKAHGTVILETTVGTDGHTHDIRVVQPLGYGLSEQAVRALRDWKFQPGTKDGQPVPVSIQIEMDFRLY